MFPGLTTSFSLTCLRKNTFVNKTNKKKNSPIVQVPQESIDMITLTSSKTKDINNWPLNKNKSSKQVKVSVGRVFSSDFQSIHMFFVLSRFYLNSSLSFLSSSNCLSLVAFRGWSS